MKWGELRPGDMLVRDGDDGGTYLLCYDNPDTDQDTYECGERGWLGMKHATFLVLPRNNVNDEINEHWTVIKA